MKKYMTRRIAGISGIIVGFYMIYQLKNNLGLIPLSLGLGMALWRYK